MRPLAFWLRKPHVIADVVEPLRAADRDRKAVGDRVANRFVIGDQRRRLHGVLVGRCLQMFRQSTVAPVFGDRAIVLRQVNVAVLFPQQRAVLANGRLSPAAQGTVLVAQSAAALQDSRRAVDPLGRGQAFEALRQIADGDLDDRKRVDRTAKTVRNAIADRLQFDREVAEHFLDGFVQQYGLADASALDRLGSGSEDGLLSFVQFERLGDFASTFFWFDPAWLEC